MVAGLCPASDFYSNGCAGIEKSARDCCITLGRNGGIGCLSSALSAGLDPGRTGWNCRWDGAGGKKIFDGDSVYRGQSMNIWLVMLLGGLITFGMRFSLIYLFGRFEVLETIRRALHYVPPAVLSAIVFPELLMPNGTLILSLDNTRLLAGLIAILVAWFTKNTLITIIAGMLALFLLKLFL